MTSTDTKKKKEDPPPSEEQQQQPHHVRAEEMTTTRSSNNNDDDSATKKNDSNYCRDNLDPTVLQKLQSGAFEQLCQHLQTRSDLVSNMELMTISGFCRNCLAKWMVLEARRLVDNDNNNQEGLLDDDTKSALNAMGYEEAAQYVYGGMTYKDWKNRYQKKATNEQLERYQASASLHAKHDKELLQTRAEKKPAAVAAAEANNKSNSSIITVEEDKAASSTTKTTTTALLQSNVCCQDPEDVIAAEPPQAATTTTTTKAPVAQQHHDTTRKTNAVPAMYQPPPIPDLSQFRHNLFPKIAIVTVSDRAFHNQYEHGDLSGPAVSDAIRRLVQPAKTETTTTTPVADLQFTMAVVPDESAAIQAKLKLLANDPRHDLILTTGGTGFAPRDVTPEATRDVVDYELPNMMSFVISESSHIQPLSSLSRGTAGILWNPHPTLIANLPGNPHAVNELIPLLLPLLLHGVVDLQLGTPEVLHIG